MQFVLLITVTMVGMQVAMVECLVTGNEFTEATSGPDEPLPSEAEFGVDAQLDLTTPGPPCKRRVVEAAGTDLKDMYLPPGVHACVAQPTGPGREAPSRAASGPVGRRWF